MNYPYYNPYQFSPQSGPQPRFDQMGANPPQMQNAPVPQQTQQGAAFLTRPVTSREEAVAAQVDFLGPGTLMPDLSHGTIYLKRFNPNTGASDFFTFTLEQPKAEPEPQWATKEDIAQLREEIEQLKPRKAVKRNDSDE